MEKLTRPWAMDRRAARRWGVGVAVAAVVAAGGGFAAADLVGGPAPGAAAITGTLTGRATELNAALNSAAATNGHRRRALARLRRLVPGMYGELTVRTKDSGSRTIAFERGVVTATGDDLTVRAANGTEWTWRLTNRTVVRRGDATVAESDLPDGEHVFVGGPLSGSTRDARLILVRRGTGAAPHATSTPSTPRSPSGSSSASRPPSTSGPATS